MDIKGVTIQAESVVISGEHFDYLVGLYETCKNQIDEIERLREESEKLKGALSELVLLKHHKEEFGKDGHYLMFQPRAWQRAEEVLPISDYLDLQEQENG